MDSIYVLFIDILKTESLILVFCCHASDMNKADPEKFAEFFFSFFLMYVPEILLLHGTGSIQATLICCCAVLVDVISENI